MTITSTAETGAAGATIETGDFPFSSRFDFVRLRDFPLIPALILGCVALVAIFANFLAPHNPEIGSLTARFKPPVWQTGGSTKYLLGTDQLGRDVLSRLIFGARVSMVVGFTAVIFAGAVGTTLGIISGYLGGWVDQVIMRLTDAWLAFPFLIVAIGLVTILGPSLTNATVALGVGATPTFTRLVRGLVLAAREEDYVRGARALGAGDARVMRRHVLPNIASAILVQATVSIPAAIIGEAILSFLGLGVQPPEPSWGTMLNGAQQFLESAPWMAWWPGLAIFLLTLSFNLAGDGLRDALDPKEV